MMQNSLSLKELESYCLNLLNFYLPDKYVIQYPLEPLLEKTLQRLEYCFGSIRLKYYNEKGLIMFNHINSDHFTTFLYFLSNTIWQETQDTELPTRFFYLNKIMHGIDLFYSVKMPEIFLLVHPLGTVLGHAGYSNYFVAYQNVTVGSDEVGTYPNFEEGTILYSKTSVIGNCNLGADVILGANAFILNTNVPDKTIVTGQFPTCTFTPNKTSVIKRVFDRVS